jgi:small-conductance mechanosensitive channel
VKLSTLMTGTAVEITARIGLIIALFVIALAAGFFLRRKVVARLKKTVLDNWIVQTLGVLVLLVPVFIGLLATPILFAWSIRGWQDIMIANNIKIDVPIIIWDLVQTILLIILGIGITRTIHTLILRSLGQNRIDINMRTLIGRILAVLIFIIIGFWILAIWKIEIGIPVAALGIVTVALTVSIQDVLKDLAAGFYILIDRPFFIGDHIAIETHSGQVKDVQLRATKLRLTSGEEVIIPNSKVFSGVIVNNSFYEERRATVLVSLREEDFRNADAPSQIIDALKAVDGILAKPEPTAVFTKYAEKKATLTVHFYVARDHQPDVISNAMFALHVTLPDAELTTTDTL